MNQVEQRYTDQQGQSVIFTWLRKTIAGGWGLGIKLGQGSSDVFDFRPDPVVREKITVSFEDFAGVEALTDEIAITTIPARAIFKAAYIEIVDGFTGGDIYAITGTLSGTNGIGDLIEDKDLSDAGHASSVVVQDAYAGSAITLTATSVDDDLENLETGVLIVHVQYEILP